MTRHHDDPINKQYRCLMTPWRP